MRHGGFSIAELVVTLLVASVILASAGPAIGRLTLDARRTADINALVAAIQLARSESAKRSAPVVVCKTLDRQSCGSSGTWFEHGWMVFVNLDDDSPPRLDAGEPVLAAHEPETLGTIRSNRPLYIFRPYFRRSTNGTITFCDRRGQQAARAVVVSYTGRPRVTSTGPGDRPLTCAG